MTNQKLRMCLLHVALKHDDVGHNVDLLEKSMAMCLDVKPDLVVTPELAVSGYEFKKAIGAEWIDREVPEIVAKFCRWAKKYGVAVILGSPTYSDKTKLRYNSALFIDERGAVLGAHHKVSVLTGSEEWSSPGQDIKPIGWRGHKIGLLICADSYTPNVASLLSQQGADVLISLAAWAPGMHGPNGEWEQRSRETGLSFFVCNRTGTEKNLDFSGGSSVVIVAGKRVISYTGERSAILTVDVKPGQWLPLNRQFRVFKVQAENLRFR